MLPISAGVIPFGLVMGSLAYSAKLTLLQTMSMNIFVFAGASQLASVNLLKNETSVIIVIITGLIINLRFVLYSAGLSQYFSRSRILSKIFLSYCITDQSYASLVSNIDKLKSKTEVFQFYIGTSLMMTLVWQVSVLIGFSYGNILPKSFSLEYAVPLSFVALVMPTIKNKRYLFVALFSSFLSILLFKLPMNLGLLLSSLCSILLAYFISRKRVSND
ncbi:AzlC family ABC transporter permease [Halobacteriovorax sp. HLS]|uniref:AzlC family ABC transporter permease n=1 Tax=Halobacteriovorax sp. HLS TaxID=2234000 RepID=UPI000FDCD304|nr:AzlC family ABC transporter permease [Halobacteriovorax sp. HLS]